VLNNIEEAVEVLAHLEGVSPVSGWAASTLTANVEEDRPSLVVPESVIVPVTLLESPLVLEVVVIELLSEILLNESILKHCLVDFS
jgi:hypothetical protein